MINGITMGWNDIRYNLVPQNYTVVYEETEHLNERANSTRMPRIYCLAPSSERDRRSIINQDLKEFLLRKGFITEHFPKYTNYICSGISISLNSGSQTVESILLEFTLVETIYDGTDLISIIKNAPDTHRWNGIVSSICSEFDLLIMDLDKGKPMPSSSFIDLITQSEKWKELASAYCWPSVK